MVTWFFFKGGCGDPPKINNARRIGSNQANYPPGSKVWYRCKPNFILKGKRKTALKCKRNGRWQKARFTCEGIAVFNEA